MSHKGVQPRSEPHQMHPIGSSHEDFCKTAWTVLKRYEISQQGTACDPSEDKSQGLGPFNVSQIFKHRRGREGKGGGASAGTNSHG